MLKNREQTVKNGGKRVIISKKIKKTVKNIEKPGKM